MRNVLGWVLVGVWVWVLPLGAVPVKVKESILDLNQDGKLDRISIGLSEGKRYRDDAQWEGVGEKFKGQFSICVEIAGHLPLTNSLNKLFYPRHAERTLFFLTKPWSLHFADYNQDGQVDFNLGQYNSGVNYDYRLFTVQPNGFISELVIEESGCGLRMADQKHSSSQISILESGRICAVDYSREQGNVVSNFYYWKPDEKRFRMNLAQGLSNIEKADALYDAGYRF